MNLFINNRMHYTNFSLHMHAEPLFAHRLQEVEIASSRTIAQNNVSWVQIVLLERKILCTRSPWL